MTKARLQRLTRPFRTFLRTEQSGGILLLLATTVALVWANLAAGSYESFWGHPLGTGFLPHDVRHWVNDVLMTVFFFVVGLEIKRELTDGELNDPRKAALPAVAALGGMVVPACLYLAFNAGRPSAGGWGVPMATDIAFALGAATLLGRRVPSSLKVFLLSLAIADDIGAIVVIAVVYSHGLQMAAIAAALILAVLIGHLRRDRRTLPVVHIALALGFWTSVMASGVHPTIAGVILGLLTPTPAALRLEYALHPVGSYFVIPLFALANAGVVIDAENLLGSLGSRVTIGVVVGLVAGKTIGIVGFSWLAVKFRVASLPDRVRWRQLSGVAMLAGIGFTVALFISVLAFEDLALQRQAKMGVLLGSLIAALVGVAVLRLGGEEKIEEEL